MNEWVIYTKGHTAGIVQPKLSHPLHVILFQSDDRLELSYSVARVTTDNSLTRLRGVHFSALNDSEGQSFTLSKSQLLRPTMSKVHFWSQIVFFGIKYGVWVLIMSKKLNFEKVLRFF